MDKDLLRFIIVLLGILVMIGMVLWHFVKTLRNSSPEEEFDEEEYLEDHEFDVEEDEDEFSGIPTEMVDEAYLPSESAVDRSAAQQESSVEKRIPSLIEFSIVARADEGFNGEALFDALEDLGLEFGTNQVFERLDSSRLVDFTVASMVGGGVFPSENLGSFFTPGIVFFMQPRELEYPDDVFEDFVQTIQQLAEELDGVVWDNQRQPLSQDTIDYFRNVFKN